MMYKIDLATLRKLAGIYNYTIPISGVYAFAIRGGNGLMTNHDAGFSVTAKPSGFITDNLNLHCVIGLVNKADIIAFPASTVPHKDALIAADKAEGKGANQLCVGAYVFNKGIHKAGSPTAHGAFRQPDIKWPIRRSADDSIIELTDIISFEIPHDNLHAAWTNSDTSGAFGSNGCQVIIGKPGVVVSGWYRFKIAAYKALNLLHTDKLDYFMFDVKDVVSVSNGVQVANKIVYGSSGVSVYKFLELFYDKVSFKVAGKLSNQFTAANMRDVITYQKENDLVPDGVVGNNTLKSLNINLYGW